MIAAAVLDTDSKDLAYIREVLTAYSIQRNKSLQVYWYTSPNSFDRLEQMIGSVCVALIAVKSGEGRTLGRRVYARNPDCRILFYGPEEQPLRPLLRARPIEYHSFSEGDAAFCRKLDDIFQEIEDAEGVFQFKSRRKNLFLPTRGKALSDRGTVERDFYSGASEFSGQQNSHPCTGLQRACGVPIQW